MFKVPFGQIAKQSVFKQNLYNINLNYKKGGVGSLEEKMVKTINQEVCKLMAEVCKDLAKYCKQKGDKKQAKSFQDRQNIFKELSKIKTGEVLNVKQNKRP